MTMFLNQMSPAEAELVVGSKVVVVVEAIEVRYLLKLDLKVLLHQTPRQDRRMLASLVQTTEVVVGEVTEVSIHMLGDDWVLDCFFWARNLKAAHALWHGHFVTCCKSPLELIIRSIFLKRFENFRQLLS
jgi:hypothetical protein